MAGSLKAGAAVADISPVDSQFLFGYPHVERYSTGVHDPLEAAALYLSDGDSEIMFIANDIIFVTREITADIRKRIHQATGIDPANIMVTATHTHSGPTTTDYLSNAADPIIPKTDLKYVELMASGIVDAATRAHAAARPAEVGLAIADGTGVGTNRRDPSGPADGEVPVMLVRSAEDHSNIAAMMVYSMHPTVLHEDSTLVTGDFPAMTKQYLRKNVLGVDCPVLYHTGPQGDQSPRHVTTANTFEEAERLGVMLGERIEKVVGDIEFSDSVTLRAAQEYLELVRRGFPSVVDAEAHLKKSVETLERLRTTGASSQDVRTAECDWFGAEETLTLAKAAVDGKLDATYDKCMPAEIQILTVGEWSFAGWCGEVFVDFPLAVKAESDNVFIIALANGELQGYIVTEAAAAEGGYEASNALFAPESGDMMVAKTLTMLEMLAR